MPVGSPLAALDVDPVSGSVLLTEQKDDTIRNYSMYFLVDYVEISLMKVGNYFLNNSWSYQIYQPCSSLSRWWCPIMKVADSRMNCPTLDMRFCDDSVRLTWLTICDKFKQFMCCLGRGTCKVQLISKPDHLGRKEMYHNIR